MEQKGNVAETSGLEGQNFFFFPISFKGINYLGHILTSISQLPIRQKFVVVKSTVEMSGVTLHLLKIDILDIIDHKGYLNRTEMFFFY